MAMSVSHKHRHTMSPDLSKAHFGLVVLIVVTKIHLLLPYHVVAANFDDNKGISSSGKGFSSPNLKARGLILVKVWCVLIAFVATFLAGMSPYFCRWNRAFLVLGTQFSGGIFLTTALVHFLSDANASFKQQTSNPYPFAFVLATFGYLLTMLSDCIISVVSHRTQLNNLSTKAVDGDFGNNGGAPAAKTPACPRGDQCDNCEETIEANKCDNKSSKAFEVKTVVPAVLVTHASRGDAVLLIFALCFHSVFEGIAIGVAETQHDAWRNLWTVCLHKGLAAVAMGLALLQILPSRPLFHCASYAFVFAASTPVGVTIGIIIDNTAQGVAADWIFAISMSIASGVFIYVAVNHLLAKKRDDPPGQVAIDNPLIKFTAVALGAAVMAVVLIWD